MVHYQIIHCPHCGGTDLHKKTVRVLTVGNVGFAKNAENIFS